jgi:ribosomal protein S4
MCRREGLKLFLKGERCYTDKCAIERRNYPPGAHGQARTRFSEFAIRLREKQKVKRIYGMLEKQFAQYFEMAERMPGITGENLLVLLERRLDNAVYRLGFSSSLAQARQLVLHGHFEVNGKVVTIPSYLLEVGQVVSANSSAARCAPSRRAASSRCRSAKSSSSSITHVRRRIDARGSLQALLSFGTELRSEESRKGIMKPNKEHENPRHRDSSLR